MGRSDHEGLLTKSITIFTVVCQTRNAATIAPKYPHALRAHSRASSIPTPNPTHPSPMPTAKHDRENEDVLQRRRPTQIASAPSMKNRNAIHRLRALGP